MEESWKPWRERIAEARARGAFTAVDLRDVWHPGSCAVGEQVHRGLLQEYLDISETPYIVEHGVLAGKHLVGGLFTQLVRYNLFDEAERVLDAVEDAALRWKRERLT